MNHVDQIIQSISSLNFVCTVDIVGSHSNDTNDKYSDVDLVVHVLDEPADKALLRISYFLCEKYSPLWYDYANSLMPNKFLVSMYFENTTPFKFIDIGIINNEAQFYNKDDFKNDKWIHLMKLWVMNFKYYVRKSERFESSFNNMMASAGINDFKNHADGFKKLLNVLSTKESINKKNLWLLYNEYQIHKHLY
ncbi:nucleotidyltransferase domain-containing protein [Alkalicoccobacillus gibsonii]|uniref:nucleotidyltransferase domain-containing protein n=1 Tax=Alkalicoccobacillus gibsonii TaxID=79881 RepID=UPI001933183B|nr:nucleotidyltransferase domain-containing protein [Alkalicoccobacillus gibsonii]MBM0067933.1 nucleotidyltransferase domain-containing protein [Alkalicoccobacillus gibsonii]